MSRQEYMKKWRENNPDKVQKYKEKQTEYTANWKKNNPKGYARKVKNNRLRKYEINMDDYEAMIAEQNGICPICKKSLYENGQIDVDHCHATGKVRGILHNKCNRLLACCEDCPERLKSAIEYIRRHNG